MILFIFVQIGERGGKGALKREKRGNRAIDFFFLCFCFFFFFSFFRLLLENDPLVTTNAVTIHRMAKRMKLHSLQKVAMA